MYFRFDPTVYYVMMSVILGLIVPRSHARSWDDESVSGVAVIKVGPSGSH